MTALYDVVTGAVAQAEDLNQYGDLFRGGLFFDASQFATVQDAIDTASAASSSNTNVATVVFRPGDYRLTSTLDWKNCNLVGNFPNSGVRFSWDGVAGGTMISRNAAANMSFFLLRGIELRSGTAEPATFVDLTPPGTGVDNFGIIELCHFGTCSDDAIKINGWTNLHWTDLRFDQIGGYAISAVTAGGQNGSSFVLDRFTYDHSRASGPGKGVIHVDNSAGATFTGNMLLANARIEMGTSWASPGAVVVVTTLNAGAPNRSVGLTLANVALAMHGTNYIVYRDSGTAGNESLTLLNCSLNSVTAVYGGTWTASFPVPPVQNYGLLVMTATSGQQVYAGQVRVASLAGVPTFSARAGADTQDRVQMLDGTILLGPGGSTAPDAGIKRTAADEVGTATGDGLKGTTYVKSGASKWSSGTGSPEGAVTGAIGDLWTQTDGGVGTAFWVKEAGAGNTGWAAK